MYILFYYICLWLQAISSNINKKKGIILIHAKQLKQYQIIKKLKYFETIKNIFLQSILINAITCILILTTSLNYIK